MNSRPLLDYLAYPDDHAEPADAQHGPVAGQAYSEAHSGDALEARLKALAARLRESAPPAPAPAPKQQDLTLSSQIEAILGRKASPAAERPQPQPHREVAKQQVRSERIAIDPPPTVPVFAAPPVDPEFAKFSEAVYLISQAAKRFVDQPVAVPAPVRASAPSAPSTAEIDALSAVLRETMSSFRSVADDIAVSAGEIRAMATRDERAWQARSESARSERESVPELRETVAAFQTIARELAASVGDIRAAARGDDRLPPARRDRRERYRDDEDEILDLRDTVTDLQDRLDALLQNRRRTRY